MTRRSLKILYLSIEYPPESPDGIGSYVVEVAAAMAGLGHEVHVLSCIPGQKSRDYWDGAVRIHRRGEPALRGLGRVTPGRHTEARIRHAAACWREVRRLGIRWDVIETPDWMAEGLVLALLRAPVIAHLHTPLAVTRRYGAGSFNVDVRLAARLERWAVERAHRVVAPSRLVADELARLGWKRAGSAAVVRYPIDSGRWSEGTPVENTTPVVLFAGRLEHLKAPEVLVDAAVLLKKEVDVEVWLAGRSGGTVDGRPYEEWLRERIADLGAPCSLLGQVSRAEIRELIHQARVLALPSRYENLPFAGLEAMAAGRPVVCTSNTGLAEIIDDAAGAVVPPGDAEALAAALRPLLVDARAAARAGARAQEVVTERCAPARVAEERERIYLDVATSPTAAFAVQ